MKEKVLSVREMVLERINLKTAGKVYQRILTDVEARERKEIGDGMSEHEFMISRMEKLVPKEGE